jgi:hypothetical protein
LSVRRSRSFLHSNPWPEADNKNSSGFTLGSSLIKISPNGALSTAKLMHSVNLLQFSATSTNRWPMQDRF